MSARDEVPCYKPTHFLHVPALLPRHIAFTGKDKNNDGIMKMTDLTAAEYFLSLLLLGITCAGFAHSRLQLVRVKR